MDKITVIVPAFNEQDNINEVIEGIRKAIPGNINILIIDDCSTDRTNAICHSMGFPNLKVKRNPLNLGKTQSILNALFDDNDSDIMAFIDGDNQYYAEDLFNVIELAKHNDVVCGRRRDRHDSLYRKFMSFFFNLFNRTMFDIKIDDVNCGMKAFRTDIFKKINIKYTKARWFIDTELLARAYRHGLKIVQVDIRHKPREKGKSGVSGIKLAIETIMYGLRLKCELW